MIRQHGRRSRNDLRIRKMFKPLSRPVALRVPRDRGEEALLNAAKKQPFGVVNSSSVGRHLVEPFDVVRDFLRTFVLPKL